MEVEDAFYYKKKLSDLEKTKKQLETDIKFMPNDNHERVKKCIEEAIKYVFYEKYDRLRKCIEKETKAQVLGFFPSGVTLQLCSGARCDCKADKSSYSDVSSTVKEEITEEVWNKIINLLKEWDA